MSSIRRWHRYFEDCKAAARGTEPFTVSGRLTRVAGLVMEAVGLKLPVGNSCYILTPSGQRVEAEVVGSPASACSSCLPLMSSVCGRGRW